jgi:hypothetical protein
MLSATFVSTASADPAEARAIIRAQIDIEETRAREMDGLAKNDDKLAKEIDKYVKVREQYAADAEARARRLHEIINGSWPRIGGADEARSALQRFARTWEEFAKHDREQARKRKQAEDILADQARDAIDAARQHREHVTELRLKLELYK